MVDPLFNARRWTREHTDVGLDLVRAYLGAALCFRGALLLAHPDLVSGYVSHVHWFWPSALAHYLIGAHLIGGLLLAIGVATRIAAAVQVPALLGAVFIVHLREGLFASGQSLELASLVLVLLVVFAVFGSGRLSVDHYLFRESQPLDISTHFESGRPSRAR